MKRLPLFPLLPQVALVLAVAYACTDSMAPASSHTVLTPNNPALAKVGDPPPPPVDVAVVVCVVGCVVVDGTYNAKGGEPGGFRVAAPGKDSDDGDDGDDEGSGVCTFAGKAWLKFDKKQRRGFDVTTKKARIRCKDLVASGKGTIEFETYAGHVVVILKEVRLFNNTQDCGLSATPCADFVARATVDGVEAEATGNAFNREYFDEVCGGEEEPGFCHGGS